MKAKPFEGALTIASNRTGCSGNKSRICSINQRLAVKSHSSRTSSGYMFKDERIDGFGCARSKRNNAPCSFPLKTFSLRSAERRCDTPNETSGDVSMSLITPEKSRKLGCGRECL